MTAPEPDAGAERDMFLAMLAHETRAPLGNVALALQLLEETPLTSPQRVHLDAARHGIGVLTSLSTDLVDFLRVGLPDFPLECVPLDPRRCVAESVEPFLAAAARKRVFLREEVAAGVPAAVPGDPLRLRQVLTNLLSNAIKFTERGGVTARVALDEAGRSLLFEVEDSGPGMDAETLGRLFEPFFQAPGTGKRFGGSGLGLTISRRLAARMGCTLTVASDSKGTLFRLALPLPEREEGP